MTEPNSPTRWIEADPIPEREPTIPERELPEPTPEREPAPKPTREPTPA